jgi:hypothetical protein
MAQPKQPEASEGRKSIVQHPLQSQRTKSPQRASGTSSRVQKAKNLESDVQGQKKKKNYFSSEGRIRERVREVCVCVCADTHKTERDREK